MKKKIDPMAFLAAKEDVMENLEAIQVWINQSVSQGMVDMDDTYYNELLGLMDDTVVMETWPEVEEIILKAKVLETDVDAWLSMHGITTVSLTWPSIPPSISKE
ncbi:MAG: hypothetical protein JSS32_05215 [Verrucomicrobia bacterium]|nr:hypothetical protein [Verrucomicrobiota bacterium]